jgi:hypothetical protein
MEKCKLCTKETKVGKFLQGDGEVICTACAVRTIKLLWKSYADDDLDMTTVSGLCETPKEPVVETPKEKE